MDPLIAGKSRYIRTKLSVMMFIQFFICGAWAVTLGTYLGKTLAFEGTQIGLIYGTTAIAAIVSPLFVGFVADRYFASQRVFSTLHFAGAMFLYLASQASSFGGIYTLLLIYSLCYMPTLAIANGIGFRHLQDPDRQFPLVRVLGTIGWIVAGLVVGFLGVEDRNIPLQIAAGMSLLLSVYGFMLPHTPPKPSNEPPDGSPDARVRCICPAAKPLISGAVHRLRIDQHPAGLLLQFHKPLSQ